MNDDIEKTIMQIGKKLREDWWFIMQGILHDMYQEYNDTPPPQSMADVEQQTTYEPNWRKH